MSKRSVKRNLQFRQGLVASPNPRDRGGVLDAQNVMLTPDGSALMPLPGYRRVYPYQLYRTVTGTPGFQVVTVPAQAFGATTGIGLAVVEEATRRVVAEGWHPGGVEQDPTVAQNMFPPAGPAPNLQDRFFTRGPNEFPLMIVARDKTLIVPVGDAVRVWDGAELRTAGILDPRFAPVFTTDNTTPTGTLGQYIIAIKYVGGIFYTHPGLSYDWTKNVLLLFSDVTATPPTVAYTLSLVGLTWAGVAAAVQAVVDTGTLPWAALVGLLVAGTDSPATLTKSAAMLAMGDAGAAAVTSSVGAQLGLKVLDPTVAFRVERTGTGDGRLGLTATTLSLYNAWTGGAADYTYTTTGHTNADIVAFINGNSGWNARIESAIASEAINTINPAVAVVLAQTVKNFGGLPMTFNTGGPGTNAVASPTKGTFPFTVTFTSQSAGSIGSRVTDFGDGTSEIQTVAAPDPLAKTPADTMAVWTHTYDGSNVASATLTGSQYEFNVAITETGTGGTPVTDPTFNIPIDGTYLSQVVSVKCPAPYTWPSNVDSLKGTNPDKQITPAYGGDLTTSRGLGTVWSQPIWWANNAGDITPKPSTEATYGNLSLLVLQKASGPTELFEFALDKDVILDATPVAAGKPPRYLANTPWQCQYCLRHKWHLPTFRYLMRGGNNNDPALGMWSWSYLDQKPSVLFPKPITTGSDAQLVIGLYNVTGSVVTHVAIIKAGSTLTDTGYLNPGVNNVVFNSALTGSQTVNMLRVGFVGAPPNWPKVPGWDAFYRNMDIQIQGITIYEPVVSA